VWTEGGVAGASIAPRDLTKRSQLWTLVFEWNGLDGGNRAGGEDWRRLLREVRWRWTCGGTGVSGLAMARTQFDETKPIVEFGFWIERLGLWKIRRDKTGFESDFKYERSSCRISSSYLYCSMAKARVRPEAPR
jgi:hypothetical protein